METTQALYIVQHHNQLTHRDVHIFSNREDAQRLADESNIALGVARTLGGQNYIVKVEA